MKVTKTQIKRLAKLIEQSAKHHKDIIYYNDKHLYLLNRAGTIMLHIRLEKIPEIEETLQQLPERFSSPYNERLRNMMLRETSKHTLADEIPVTLAEVKEFKKAYPVEKAYTLRAHETTPLVISIQLFTQVMEILGKETKIYFQKYKAPYLFTSEIGSALVMPIVKR